MDAAVIGGGVIGLAVAWRAARAGLCVAVVDPDPGSGASHFAAGMIAPVGEAEFGEEAVIAINRDSASRYPSFIAELEREHGVSLMPEGATGSLTGHIDFLQVRNRAVHILDYKPDARTNKPVAQLTIYALALTHLVPGIKLFDIKCAWFNENCYNEFFPRLLLPRP